MMIRTNTQRISEDERLRRLDDQVRRLPKQLENAYRRVDQYEKRALELKMHDIVRLRESHHNGDLIASEWLARLGVMP